VEHDFLSTTYRIRCGAVLTTKAENLEDERAKKIEQVEVASALALLCRLYF